MKLTNPILTSFALVTIALLSTSCLGQEKNSTAPSLTNTILDLECTKADCTDRETGNIWDKMVHAILDLKRPEEISQTEPKMPIWPNAQNVEKPTTNESKNLFVDIFDQIFRTNTDRGTMVQRPPTKTHSY